MHDCNLAYNIYIICARTRFHFGDGSTVISGAISTNPSAMQAASYEAWVKVEEYSGSKGWVVSQYLLLNHPLRWMIS